MKYTLALLVGFNLFIILSGKYWLYKTVSATYFNGHTSSYIDDYINFPTNTIKDGNHQEWLISKEYNKAQLPEFIKPINDKLGRDYGFHLEDGNSDVFYQFIDTALVMYS